MGERGHDNSYETVESIIRAVHGRWRRRFLLLVHMLISFFVLMQVAYVTSLEQAYRDFATGETATYMMTQYTYVHQTTPGLIWAAIVGIHLLYVLIAELRDRAVRREIERSRKWRLLEGLEWAEPEVRSRVLRLAETREDELIDFDTAAWESHVKSKRG